jgi:hypothetical protein
MLPPCPCAHIHLLINIYLRLWNGGKSITRISQIIRGLAEFCTFPSSEVRRYPALAGKKRNRGPNSALGLKLLQKRMRSILPRSTICSVGGVLCILVCSNFPRSAMLVCCSVLKGPPSNDTLLSLTTNHYLSILTESSDECSIITSKEATRLRATTLPTILDVILASSNLRFNITARCNNQKIPESDLARSALIRELSRFMRRVGFATISGLELLFALTISFQYASEIGLEACSGPVSNHGVVSCTYTNRR